MKYRAVLLLIASTLVSAGCATRAVHSSPSRPSEQPAVIPSGLQWYLTSAEKRAVYEQIYRDATDRILQNAANRKAGSWAVIADADETLLDNAEYQLWLARTGERYSEASWQPWVRKRHAVALPGSRQFTDRIVAAGGRIVVVTNRQQPICDDTMANLAAERLTVAAVLCAQIDPATGKAVNDKNPRFAAVQNGTAAADLPALEVVGWLGDNIADFPDRSQQNAGPMDDFGRRYFVFPNPMYGSWEKLAIP